MRSLLYLLTLTVSCFLKNVNCVNKNVEKFKSNKEAMDLVGQYYNYQINTQKDLNEKLKEINIHITDRTLNNYLNEITEAGGGSRYISFDRFISNEKAMSLVGQYYDQQNEEIDTQKKLLEKLKNIGVDMGKNTLTKYLKTIAKAKETMEEEANKFLAEARQRLYERQYEVAMQSVPGFDATPYLPQSQSMGWSGPSTFVPSQAGTDSTNFFGENSQNNEGTLESMIRKPSSSEGLSSHYGSAMPSQQIPPMPGTSFPAFPNQPSNQPAPLNLSTNWDWSGGNSQNNEGTLESMIRTGKPGSSKNASQGFNTTPFLPNQSQLSSITGSAPHYGDAMPSQQAPLMDDTFMLSQAGTDSSNFFGLNSQNNDGDLYSVVRPKKPRN